MDDTGYSNYPLGAERVDDKTLAPFAANYKLLEPMEREIARLNFEGKLQAVSEEKGKPTQTLNFGAWQANVSYGLPQFGFNKNPPGNAEPVGRALVAQLADNEFLVTGFACRVDFAVADAAAGKKRQFLRVEEGSYQGGRFAATRIWNGDQTDSGLNFTSALQVLQVKLATY